MAMLGHELRNPLAPILTALHLMRLRAGGVAERERTVIERQVNHLTRLVDDLLDVSRITRGKVQLHRKPFEIAEVVAKAIEMASPLLEQRRHHLEVSVPPRGLVVNADLTRLSQVVDNLLTNAAKYTDPGGNIVIEAAREGREARDAPLEASQVVLRVRDDGIGIAAEMLPHVFETFVQERQAIDRSQGGLGLGLAIVKSLTALHDGQVEAHSAGVGRGSEFTLRLPSDHAAPDPTWLPDSATGSAPRARRDGLRILVVDDNEDAATLLADALDLLGHETRIAHDSPRAIYAVKDFTPDVAFLDIGLPVMDGYELGRRLREEAGLEKLRLVAVSGYGQESDLRRSQEAGFQEHLVKPVAQAKLESVLASLGGPPSGPALDGAAS
jgi:CheY-like chemotaxis protein